MLKLASTLFLKQTVVCQLMVGASMDTDFLFVLFNLFIFIAAVMAVQDRSRIKQLRQKVAQLQQHLERQSEQLNQLKDKLSQPPVATKETESGHEAKPAIAPEPSCAQQVESNNPWQGRDSEPLSGNAKTNRLASFRFDTFLRGNGILWLGAVVLALGGVFLAKYSIDSGLLPPSVRVVLGALFGVVLLAAGHVLDRNKSKFNISTPYIPAALASAGVVTCFAMALVSLQVYQFIPPSFAFVLLASISLLATYFALRFGPILAAIGVVGSYLVPMLVSTGSNNVLGLLLYVSFVSLSAVWVMAYVNKTWLWWLSFCSHFCWFAIALTIANSSDFIAILLFALVSIYLYSLTNILGWRLGLCDDTGLSLKQLLQPRKELAAVSITLLLLALYLMMFNQLPNLVVGFAAVASVLLLVSYRHSQFDTLPFLALVLSLLVYWQWPQWPQMDDYLLPYQGPFLFIQVVLVAAIGFSMLMMKRYPQRQAYLLLLVLSPLCLFGISYINSPEQAKTYLYPAWVVEMLLFACCAAIGATIGKRKEQQVAWLVLANAMVTLSCTMLLSASTLTLAFVVQLSSLSYLSKKYDVAIPHWLYKAVLVIVLARLSFAPWLADYKDELIFSVHWTLVVYPLVLLMLSLAIKYQQAQTLRLWLTGVFIHVLALFVTTETSYLLTGDYPDFANLSYHESILLAFNWLVLALVYLIRLRHAESMAKLYRVAVVCLLSACGLIHLDISLFNNPFLTQQFVGTGVINWTGLQWLLPALILVGAVKGRLVTAQYSGLTYLTVTGFLLLFVNGLIRGGYQQGYLHWQLPTQQAELYTYSAVWLVISTAAIFIAQQRQQNWLMQLGFAGLALVILKAFGIDMSHLQGLLRALSFIGLGLSLVAIGWLFQKLQTR